MPRGQTEHIERYRYPSIYGKKTTSVKLPILMLPTAKAIALLLKDHPKPEEVLEKLEEYAKQLVKESVS